MSRCTKHWLAAEANYALAILRIFILIKLMHINGLAFHLDFTDLPSAYLLRSIEVARLLVESGRNSQPLGGERDGQVIQKLACCERKHSPQHALFRGITNRRDGQLGVTNHSPCLQLCRSFHEYVGSRPNYRHKDL